jgi:hypothetical protein
MLLELVGGYAIFLLALFVYAEAYQKPVLALIASILIFPLGAWILGDGIQVETGGVVAYSGNNTIVGENHASFTNTTSDSDYNETEIMGQNATTTKTYADIPNTPYLGFSELIGLLCFLLGLYSMFHYALKMMPRV